ncbi:MAG: F0F1 ATP synthase subunit epsilon [Actinomycetota bacterium]
MAFQVEFVSPEATLYSDVATQVVARTRGGGEIAFLTGHEPFIGSLLTCEVRVTEEATGDVKSFAVRGGFVSVTGTMSETKITVLSDAAEPADEIDRAQAEADLAAATEALKADADDAYARDDLRWAEVRLAAIGADAGAH